MRRKQQTRREKMSDLERKEINFENAVNRLDKRFMTSLMTQEDYDFLYAELKKKFELV
jgi:hypothetical protein